MQTLAPPAVDIMGTHRTADVGAAIAAAEIIIVSGGNAFHLVKHCRYRGLLRAILSEGPELER